MVSIFHQALLKAKGHEDIAEKMRKAFSDQNIDITQGPLEALALPEVISEAEHQAGRVLPSGDPLPTPQEASDRGTYPHKLPEQYRPFDKILEDRSKPEVPSPPPRVFVPADVAQLNSEFSLILGAAYGVVSSLSDKKLGSLRTMLSGLLRENCFDKARELPTDGDKIAELVVSRDQDFINFTVLSHSVKMINDAELSKMLEEYEKKLTAYKEKCLVKSPQSRRKLTKDGNSIVICICHRGKSTEEFQFSHVVQEHSYLVSITDIARVRFEGFACGSVYLYFSMPEDSVYLLLSALREDIMMLREWRITHVTVYDYFLFDLEEGLFVSWRPEIEKRYKDEIETLRKDLEALRVADKMKKMTERQKQEQKTNIFDVLVSENASLKKNKKELEESKEVSESKLTEANKEIEELKRQVEMLTSKDQELGTGPKEGPSS